MAGRGEPNVEPGSAKRCDKLSAVQVKYHYNQLAAMRTAEEQQVQLTWLLANTEIALQQVYAHRVESLVWAEAALPQSAHNHFMLWVCVGCCAPQI